MYRTRRALRLIQVEALRAARRDGAETACPGADVAEQQKGRGRLLPALAHGRAMRLLPDGVQALLAHKALQADIVRSPRKANLEPGRPTLALGRQAFPRIGRQVVHRCLHGARGAVAVIASAVPSDQATAMGRLAPRHRILPEVRG